MRRTSAPVAPDVIEVVTVIEAAAATVFDLELDVDVHAGSMARYGESAATPDGRRRLGPGDEVTFRARHFGLNWRMTSRITAYERPAHFVDEQTRGPFREMRHEHRFEDLGDGRTRMIDRMTIRAPGGWPGAIVSRLLLAPYLKRLLIRRASHIRHLAEAATRRP
jgi:ligand-binding SRPBCC domain-containing protein